MQTKILSPNTKNYAICADLINSGGLVAFATETVYGLGANALDEQAVSSIFAVKGRPPDNPLIVHVSEISRIKDFAHINTQCARLIMSHFMPGPVTVVLQKKDIIPGIVTAGLDTVGIRMPDNAVAQGFLGACFVPVAAPSANLSGRPSPTTAEAVLSDLKGRIPYILDGGPCSVGIESTVIDATRQVPVILRQGMVTSDDILRVCGSVSGGVPDDSMQRRSPGMRYRHYAPDCTVIVVAHGDYAALLRAMSHAGDAGSRVAVIGFDKTLALANLENKPAVMSFGNDGVSAANKLYFHLASAEKKCDTLIIELAPGSGTGSAVNDRIMRAAGLVG